MTRQVTSAGIAATLACALVFVALEAQSAPLVSVGGETSGGSSPARTPLVFVPNRGQHQAEVLFQARDGSRTLSFGHRGVAIAIADETVALRFAGADPRATIQPGRRAEGKVNYLVGPRARHRTGLPVYRRITYRDLWPGIDLTFKDHAGRLRYELYVRPGANPRDIRLTWRGAQGLSLTNGGGLRVDTRAGAILDAPPRTFQRVGARKNSVASRYLLSGSTVGFAVGKYDRKRTLVIDPELSYSTYLGGLGTDRAETVDVDSEGHAYVAGGTSSGDYPTTGGAIDRDPGPADNRSEAFITKLKPDGSGLVWSTYLGGSSFGETIDAIDVDRAGSAHVAGITYSNDFPTTPGAHQTTHNGRGIAIVAKLSADGSRLVYSTYFGYGDTYARGIAVDPNGAAYVAGRACCGGGIDTTPGAYENSSRTGWVAKLGPTGELLHGTYLGVSDLVDIAIDPIGSAYVLGESVGNIFPTTAGAFQASRPGGGGDFTVSKFSPDLSRLDYSTWLGGNDSEDAFAIDVDRRGHAYVVGDSDSDNFPTTPGAYQTSPSTTCCEGTITKFNPTGTGLVYSTFLGGHSFIDTVSDVRVDPQGSAYVVGSTNSSDFPTTPDAPQRQKPGQSGLTDGFLSKLDPTGSRLVASTYIGGQVDDSASGLAIDAAGAAYVVGETRSSDFPISSGAYDRTLAIPSPPPSRCCVIDSFAAKFLFRPGPPASLTLAPATASNPIGTGHCVTGTVADVYGAPLAGITIRFRVEGAVTADGTGQSNSSGQAQFCYGGTELPGSDRILAFADTDGSGDQVEGEPGAEAQKTWALPPSSAGCRVSGSGVITTQSGRSARFINVVRSTSDSGARGHAAYSDPGGSIRFRSRSIDTLACDGRRATIYGTATLPGGPSAFRIDMEDRGKRADTYRILLGTGYDSGARTVQRGGVRVKG